MRIFYRTRDGRSDYCYSIERDGSGGLRIYIEDMPSYGARATGLHITHRLCADGRYYICWTRPLMTLDAAKQVAALWADLTQVYISTGQTIDAQVAAMRRNGEL